MRIAFKEGIKQDGIIDRFFPKKLERGEPCFLVKTPDNKEDFFSLREVEEGILDYATHHRCNLTECRTVRVHENGYIQSLAVQHVPSNIFNRYLPYVKAFEDGNPDWHCDIYLSPHLRPYEESLRWLGDVTVDDASPQVDLTIGIKHSGLLTTCRQWCKQLQSLWSRCFRQTCLLLEEMPQGSVQRKRLASFLDLLPLLLLRRDDGQSQRLMERSIRRRCQQFLGGDWSSLYQDLHSAALQASLRRGPAIDGRPQADTHTHNTYASSHAHAHASTSSTHHDRDSAAATSARVSKVQWEAQYNLRKAFQTLTRTDEVAQDAGAQLQTKFPPRPADARDPLLSALPPAPRLEDYLDSVDASGNLVKGAFHVPTIVKLLRRKKWLGAQDLNGMRLKEHLLPLFDNTDSSLHHLVIRHCLFP